MIFFQGHTDMIRSNQSPVLVESARTRARAEVRD